MLIEEGFGPSKALFILKDINVLSIMISGGSEQVMMSALTEHSRSISIV